MKIRLWFNIHYWEDWLPKSYQIPSLTASIHYDDYHQTTKMTPLLNYQWWGKVPLIATHLQRSIHHKDNSTPQRWLHSTLQLAMDCHPSTKKNPLQRWFHSSKMTPLHSTTVNGLPPIYKDESTTKMNPLHKDDPTPQLSMVASTRTEPLANC